ncbi:MerR family transcriptional regulator [Alkalicoccus halolimnae]|uniref:MerR family transcriptional regulator n=1 Tax=Alkalicoccus halolimnae TaxID=1667239 RepID=A0A5C7F3N7_9BACI|nr:MerR family transcriptional regulator [Alkalicoccus halolimnae]TXF85271.1 MerR family transcriptional regulator [Alkalicoccus halolimnae]
MKIKEVADLVGISVRTLHHYDEIGLLPPEEITESGYRLYSEENIEMLQQILFFKELGFSLKEIKKIISSSSFNRQEALILQRKMLVEKRKRLDKMIVTIDKTIKSGRGEIEMTNEEKFEGINFQDNPYEQEARERWGDSYVDTADKKLRKMSQDEQTDLSERWDMILNKLADLREQPPESREVQETIKEWYEFLNHNFSSYSPDMFYGLGQLYIDDERFTKNIDKHGKGLAEFMSEAMKIFAVNQK